MTPIQAVIRRNKIKNTAFAAVGLAITLAALSILLILLSDLIMRGLPRVSVDFLTNFPSRFPERAGILSAWVGSLLITLVTATTAVPLGIAAGVYLEEYAEKNWLTAFIEINIANLASVPSIVFGLMALGLFVYKLNLGQSVLTAGLTLGLLILPIIIVTTREAIRSVPTAIREASYAVGATRWQTVRNHILPYSLGGILTGVIIAISRALGETAPLVTIGALTYIAFLPASPVATEAPFVSMDWLFSAFTVLPIQMFNWISRPQEAFHVNAAATGLILVTLTLSLNSVAIVVRTHFRRRIRW